MRISRSQSGRQRKKNVRLEIIYDKSKEGAIWTYYNDKDKVAHEAALTLVGFPDLQQQSTRNKYVKFYDMLSEKIVRIPTWVMLEYMSENVIKLRKEKMPKEERERVEKAEKEIEREVRRMRRKND